MKQNLRLIFMTLLCAVFSTAWGEEVTDVLNRSLTGVSGTTYTNWSGKTSNSNAVYSGNSAGGNDAIQLRSDKSTSGIISTTTGGKVKKVEVTWYDGTSNGRTLQVYGKNTAYTDASDLYNSSNQGTLLGTIVKGTSTELTISGDYTYIGLRSASGAMYLSEIKITWGGESTTQTVATPTFTPSEGTFTGSLSVTIECSTNGASIYYTTDNTDPTASSTLYTTAIPISETTTIKAIAVKEDMENSAIASATYTKLAPKTIAEVRAQETGSVVYTEGVVTSVNGKTAYIQDNTAGICVYGNSDITFAVGDDIKVQGTLSTHKGLLEITSPTYEVVSTGNTVTPVVKTIAEINNGIQGILVKIEDAKVTAIDNKNTTIAQGDNTIIVYDIPVDVVYAVGDFISLTGNVGCYNTVQIVNPTDINVQEKPSITVQDTNISLSADESEGTINVTYKEIVTKSLILCDANGDETTYDWIEAELNASGNIDYLVGSNSGEERKAYLKVSGEDEEGETYYSALITITQAAPVAPIADYAELPFEFDGGRGDIESTAGLTQEGLDSDYGSSPKLKFNTTGDWLILHFNERPGKLKFDINGNSFSGGTFTVQTSADGETYTDLKAYTELSSTPQSEEFVNLDNNVRYIKWIYTSKSSGNVGLGNITLAEYTEPGTHTLTITPNNNADISVSYNNSETPIVNGDNVQANSIILVSVVPHSGYKFSSLSVTEEDGEEVTLTKQEGNKWTFTMPESNVTVSAIVSETSGNIYTKVTSTADLTNGSYLIVYEGASVAFNGSLETLDVASNTIDVQIDNNQILGDDDIDKATFDITYGYIKSSSGKYIGRAGGSTGFNQYDAPSSTNNNTIDFDEDGNVIITASGGCTLRFNKTSNQTRFRYYKDNGQEAIQLYKLIEPATSYSIKIGSTGYATLYNGMKNLVVPANVTATTYKANASGRIEKSKVYDAESVIPAGEAVVLSGEEDTYEFVVTDNAATRDSENVLHGRDNAGPSFAPEAGDYKFYMLSLDANNENVGFYFYDAEGGPFESAAHKAYLALPKTGNSVQSFSFDDLNAIHAVTAAQATNGEVYSLSGVRMNVNSLPKGIYIVNGKKVIIK